MAFFTEVLLPLEGAKIRQGLQLPSQDSTAFSGASALPSASGHNFGFAAVAWQQSSEDARSLSLHLHQQHRPMQDCMVTLPQPLLCPLCLYQHQGELLLCGVSSELTVHLMPLLATDNQQAFTLEHLQVGQRHGSPTSHLTAELTAAHLQQIGQPKLSVAVGSHLVVATSQGVMLRATLTGHAGKHKITWSELRMKSRRLTIFRSQAPSIIDLAASSQSPIVLALHADGSLHVWDLSTGQQTSQQKLPLPADSSHLIPARLKCNDASGTASVAVQMDAAGTDGVVQSSQVCVYRLQGADPAVLIGVCDSPVGPLQDVLLQPLQGGDLRIWLLGVSGGVTAVSANKHASATAQLQEDGLDLLLSGTHLQLMAQDDLWEELQSQLQQHNPESDPETLMLLAPRAAAQFLLGPGTTCLAAFAEALKQCDQPSLATDLAVRSLEQLRDCFVKAAHRLQAEEGPMGAVRVMCSAYLDAWAKLHAPVAFVQPAADANAHAAVGIVRGGGPLLSLLLPASRAQQLLGTPQAPPQVTDAGIAGDACSTIASLFGPLTIALIVSSLDTSTLSSTHVLLPAMVKALLRGPNAHVGDLALVMRKQASQQWRRQRARLPLVIAARLSSIADPLKAIAALADSMSQTVPGADDSALWSSSSAVTGAVLAVAHAQATVALQGLLLASYIEHTRTLGTWSLPATDMAALAQGIVPQLACQLRSAALLLHLASHSGNAASSPAPTDASALLHKLRLGGSPPHVGGTEERQLHATSAQGTLLDKILPWLLPDHRQAHPRSAVLTALGLVRGSAHHKSPEKALHEQALRLAEALFVTNQLQAIPALLNIVGPAADSPALQLFQGLALLHDAANNSSTAGREDDAQAASQPLFRAANALRDASEDASMHEGGFGSPIDSSSGRSPWGGGAVAVTDRGILRRAIEHLSIAAAGRYDREGPQAEELQYYEVLMQLAESLGLTSIAAAFALAALHAVPRAFPDVEGSAQPDISMAAEGDDADEHMEHDGEEQEADADAEGGGKQARQGRLWANVFAYALQDGRYEEAYAAAKASPVPQRQLEAVQRLVTTLASSQSHLAMLCRLPFSGRLTCTRNGRQVNVLLLAEALKVLQQRADYCSLAAQPQPYQVLYSFFASRQEWRGAAAAQLAHARRLQSERHPSAEQLLSCLGAAVNALSLVESQFAWLEDPAFARSSDDSLSASAAEPIVTLEGLRRECAIARAGVALRLSGPDACRPRSAKQLLQMLLTEELHEAAVELADVALSGSARREAHQESLCSLARRCVRLQQAEAAARVSMQQQGASQLMSSAQTASEAWELLQQQVLRLASGDSARSSGMCRLPTAVASAILGSGSRLQLPCWLTALFTEEKGGRGGMAGGTADPAALLRLYIQHGKLEEATRLTVQSMSAWRMQAADVKVTHNSAWFPATQIAALQAQLQTSSIPNARQCHKQLSQELLEKNQHADWCSQSMLAGARD